MLECVDTDWFHTMQSAASQRVWTDIYQSAPLSVLELTTYPLPPFPTNSKPGDIAWFEFGYELSSVGDSNARIYKNLFSGGSAAKITFHEPREMGWQGKGPMGVTGRISQITTTPASQVEQLQGLRYRLANVDCSGGVAIYDVGQGACQAGLDSDLHLPQMYIDFGGGVLANLKTFPEALKGFCFMCNPIVVLSH